MKLTVNKNDVIDVLAKVQGLTGRKSNLAITENLLIRSESEGITIIATDLEAGFEEAGIRVRKERATPLKLNGMDDDNLKQAMETRTRDWSMQGG